MLGAIIGDMVGSRFEFDNHLSTDFELFTDESTYTDDTICTVAIAEAILHNYSFEDALLKWCRKYPNPKGGYGGSFNKWIHSDYPAPYDSFGNGSAMRVSPVAWYYNNTSDVFKYAEKSAICTHNHKEGIKGAQAVAYAILLCRHRFSKEEIKTKLQGIFEYDLYCPVRIIRENNFFDETCQITVPQAITCFLEGTNFEETIRLAVSIGGDSDTIAAIAGSIAEAYYPIPEWIKEEALKRIPNDMKEVVKEFYKKTLGREL